MVPVQKQRLVGLALQFHFCRHSPVRLQKMEGIARPGEAPQFETLLAYNKWVISDTKFKKKSQDESLQFKIWKSKDEKSNGKFLTTKEKFCSPIILKSRLHTVIYYTWSSKKKSQSSMNERPISWLKVIHGRSTRFKVVPKNWQASNTGHKEIRWVGLNISNLFCQHRKSYSSLC